MDKPALKEYIKNYFRGRKINFNEPAVERLLDPRYLKEDTLGDLSDDDVKKAVDPILDACIKRFERRTKRTSVEGLIMRDIDTRAVVRNLSGDTPPYGTPKPEPEPEPAEAAEGEGEAAAESEAEEAKAES